MSDKFKAIVEDTKHFQLELDLAATQEKREEEAAALQRQREVGIPYEILRHLPPPISSTPCDP